MRLSMERLSIPFKVAFKHASAERSETSSVWVEARSKEGTTGYGEGAPRDYVTGETLESAAAFFFQHQASIETISDLNSLRAWLSEHQSIIDANPAAWCAIELALLDVFAKQAKQTVEQYLGLPALIGTHRYSAILGDNALPTFLAQYKQYRTLGMTDFKIKVGTNREHDRAKMEALRANGGEMCRVRLDANNAWQDAETAISHLRELADANCPVEEPLGRDDLSGLRRIARTLGTAVILDESMLRLGQLDALSNDSENWILNVRVSKMGGVLRSLALVERARAMKVRVIVGAQVGETSILTRAALTVAEQAGEALVAQEGAFGTHLLSEDVCTPSLMFGHGGILEGARVMPATATGWGLSVRRPERYLSACHPRVATRP